MEIRTLDWAQYFPRPCQEVYSFFSDVRNLHYFLPRFMQLSLVSPIHTTLVPGLLFDYELRLSGVPLQWRTRIEEVEEGRRFVDAQARGPYRLFRHLHEFFPVDGGTLMVDRVEYIPPGGPLASLVDHFYVRPALLEIFSHRRVSSAKILGAFPGQLRAVS